jgi:hypothetical protein
MGMGHQERGHVAVAAVVVSPKTSKWGVGWNSPVTAVVSVGGSRFAVFPPPLPTQRSIGRGLVVVVVVMMDRFALWRMTCAFACIERER